jgi:hypothetical protein
VDGDIRAFASIDGTDLPLNANGILAFPEKNVKDGAKIR